MTNTQNSDVRSLAFRVRDYFGMEPGTAIKEYKALSDQDKVELVEAFNVAGMPTVLSTAKPS